MQDCKDWSGLQFIKFDLLTGGQEIKPAIEYCIFSSYFLVSITFGDGFFHFQHNEVSLKQAPGHNHENTIFQPRNSAFNMYEDDARLIGYGAGP